MWRNYFEMSIGNECDLLRLRSWHSKSCPKWKCVGDDRKWLCFQSMLSWWLIQPIHHCCKVVLWTRSANEIYQLVVLLEESAHNRMAVKHLSRRLRWLHGLPVADKTIEIPLTHSLYGFDFRGIYMVCLLLIRPLKSLWNRNHKGYESDIFKLDY